MKWRRARPDRGRGSARVQTWASALIFAAVLGSGTPSAAASAGPPALPAAAAEPRIVLAQQSPKSLGAELADRLIVSARISALEREITALDRDAMAAVTAGDFKRGEAILRQALVLSAAFPVKGSELVSLVVSQIATVIYADGRPDEAIDMLRQLIQRLESRGQEQGGSGATVAALNVFAALDIDQGRSSEAESLLRRSLAINAERLHDRGSEALSRDLLGQILAETRRPEEAERELRASLALYKKVRDGPLLATDAQTSLARLIGMSRGDKEADSLFRTALATQVKSGGPDSVSVIVTEIRMGDVYLSQADYGRARQAFGRALDIATRVYPPDNRTRLVATLGLAAADAGPGLTDPIAMRFRTGCAAISMRQKASLRYASAAFAASLPTSDAAACNWYFLRASLESGGRPASRSFLSNAELFEVAQAAFQSTAAEALARAWFRTASHPPDLKRVLEAYETASLRHEGLESAMIRAMSGESRDPAAVASINAARVQAEKELARLDGQIARQYPNLLDQRSAGVLPLAALQSAPGRPGLLRPDEALVYFLAPQQFQHGFVFVVTSADFAWAQLPATATDLDRKVRALRAQIDPEAFGVKAGSKTGTFDRNAASVLYDALFGDPRVAALIQPKSTLLIVPGGALNALPFAALVTHPSPGGYALNPSAQELRATPWLLREKAISILPAVGSLKALRAPRADPRGTVRTALLAFADPTFDPSRYSATTTAARGQRSAGAAMRDFNALYSDGRPRSDMLRRLPQLPGTKTEAEQLARTLGAVPGISLVTGAAATETELKRRSGDGRLAQARVIEFATHGLAGGELSGDAEPGLALAAPPAGASPNLDDGYLAASEAAGLRLRADWVILSACNTASPDSIENEGLSGLTRAFLYAGARRLLVTLWSVRDDVAASLVPGVMDNIRRNPRLTAAEALRRASLSILDDQRMDAAAPDAWAAFTLVGESGP